MTTEHFSRVCYQQYCRRTMPCVRFIVVGKAYFDFHSTWSSIIQFCRCEVAMALNSCDTRDCLPLPRSRYPGDAALCRTISSYRCPSFGHETMSRLHYLFPLHGQYLSLGHARRTMHNADISLIMSIILPGADISRSSWAFPPDATAMVIWGWMMALSHVFAFSSVNRTLSTNRALGGILPRTCPLSWQRQRLLKKWALWLVSLV